MKFEEAIKALKKGKKVRRTITNEGSYLFLDGAIIRKRNGDAIVYNINDFDATDWEIYLESNEEKEYCGVKMGFEYYCNKDHPCRNCRKKFKEDNWNFMEDGEYILVGPRMKTLKAKILKEIEEVIFHRGSEMNRVKEIINKRFGF